MLGLKFKNIAQKLGVFKDLTEIPSHLCGLVILKLHSSNDMKSKICARWLRVLWPTQHTQDTSICTLQCLWRRWKN